MTASPEKPTYTVETAWAVVETQHTPKLEDPGNIGLYTLDLFESRDAAVDYGSNEVRALKVDVVRIVGLRRVGSGEDEILPLRTTDFEYLPHRVWVGYTSEPTRRAREQWEAARAKLTDEEWATLQRGPRG